MIRKLWLKWKYRDLSRSALRAHYDLLLKSARRCAHDLDHVVGDLPLHSMMQNEMAMRARHWLDVFSPDGVKNYRLKLHEELDSLERENDSLRAELEEAGIVPKTPRSTVF